jgi:hypothetical protein
MREQGGLGRWVRVTGTGWVVGIPLVAALALLGEAAGIGGIQVLVGLGMGAGIGWMQGRVMRGMLQRFWPWFWSCVAGLGLPFLAVDVAKLLSWNFPYYPYSCVALSGLIVGVWQSFLLRTRFQHTGWWIVGSVLGWSLAAGLVGIADALFRSRSIRGIGGGLLYLACLAGGGFILGLVTGLAFSRLRPQKMAA